MLHVCQLFASNFNIFLVEDHLSLVRAKRKKKRRSSAAEMKILLFPLLAFILIKPVDWLIQYKRF